MYFGFSDSLLKSQKIHCLNGIEKACKYLDASQKLIKDI